MYKTIYCFHYKLAEKKNPSPSTFAAGGVIIAQMIHLALLYLVIKKISGLALIPKTDSFTLKLIVIPFSLIWLYLTNLYFNKKKREKIISTYEEKNISKNKGILLMLLYMLLPTILFFVIGL